MELHEEIEKAYKRIEEAHFPGIEYRIFPSGELISLNTHLYYILWRTTLHYNNCKNGCDDNCITSAQALATTRLKHIANGMPDLHPKEEAKVWELAWPIHRLHTSNSSMAPPWADSFADKCDCFTKAYEAYKNKTEPRKPTKLLPIQSEDFWYESRLE